MARVARRTVPIRIQVYEQLRREAAALGMPVTRLVEDRLLGRRTPTEELLAMAERVRQLEEMTGLRSKTG